MNPFKSTARPHNSQFQLIRAFVFLFLAGYADCFSTLAQNAITSGGTVAGAFVAPGGTNSWTFDASEGDGILLSIGQPDSSVSLFLQLTVLDPVGATVASSSGNRAARVSLRAAASGAFTVIVGSPSPIPGAYRLTLAKSGGQITVPPGNEGGPLTNGTTQMGAIQAGDLDVWSFTASAGDGFVIGLGKVNLGDTLYPTFWVYGPDGALYNNLSFYGNPGVHVAFSATNGGTFTVVVGSYNPGDSGAYLLTLAKGASPVTISPGDEGGPLTNGAAHTGVILPGDLDAWTFTANAGDGFLIGLGTINPGDSLYPIFWLYGPDGASYGDAGFYGTPGVHAAFRATNSGTFTVVVASYSGSDSGSYRLHLAKGGAPITVSPGDEGGPMINGAANLGTIQPGALHSWTFPANAGEGFVIGMGKIDTNDTIYPTFWVYGPDGASYGDAGFFGTPGIHAALKATNSGTFTVVAGSYSGANAGGYRLKLAKGASPITVSPGDDGGTMTNGLTHTGAIQAGDVDAWSFTASAGEGIIIGMGKLNPSDTLYPNVWVFGPDGAPYGNAVYFGAPGVHASLVATNGGTFTVVASSYGAGDAGGYRLKVAEGGHPFVIAPGEAGGPLTGNGVYTGIMQAGDIEMWSFASPSGAPISLRLDSPTGDTNFFGILYLFDRGGNLLTSLAARIAPINIIAPTDGIYTVVVSDYFDNVPGTMPYRLQAPALYLELEARPKLTGSGIVFHGAGGQPGSLFNVLTTTNLTDPAAKWKSVLTNQFGSFGEFSFANPADTNLPAAFFRLVEP